MFGVLEHVHHSLPNSRGDVREHKKTPNARGASFQIFAVLEKAKERRNQAIELSNFLPNRIRASAAEMPSAISYSASTSCRLIFAMADWLPPTKEDQDSLIWWRKESTSSNSGAMILPSEPILTPPHIPGIASSSSNLALKALRLNS
ncbi:hypothetical protein ACJ73_08980 [Blastomyces percursus]|uniref:Uncharacterized protein n=1 Tax=Blastomyces percursus TaxID=1658174 RepID=A0A1J9PHP3_9EURO|nr:hypothetical protein ACJ73_08980 [Blastomyces percursus]